MGRQSKKTNDVRQGKEKQGKAEDNLRSYTTKHCKTAFPRGGFGTTLHRQFRLCYTPIAKREEDRKWEERMEKDQVSGDI